MKLFEPILMLIYVYSLATTLVLRYYGRQCQADWLVLQSCMCVAMVFTTMSGMVAN